MSGCCGNRRGNWAIYSKFAPSEYLPSVNWVPIFKLRELGQKSLIISIKPVRWAKQLPWSEDLVSVFFVGLIPPPPYHRGHSGEPQTARTYPLCMKGRDLGLIIAHTLKISMPIKVLDTSTSNGAAAAAREQANLAWDWSCHHLLFFCHNPALRPFIQPREYHVSHQIPAGGHHSSSPTKYIIIALLTVINLSPLISYLASLLSPEWFIKYII